MSGGKRAGHGKGGGASQAVIDPIAANEALAELMFKPTNPEVTPEEKELVDSTDRTIHPRRFSVVAIIVALLVVGAGTIGGFWIKSDERLKENWFLFWEGHLADEYKQRAQAEFDRNEKVDRWTLNHYGDVTLFYSPRDSHVKVTQVAYTEAREEFVSRYIRGGADKRKAAGEKELEQVGKKTTGLKADQYFQNLPIKFLPLVERGEDGTVTTFEYKVEVNHVNASGKQDYKPRKYLIHSPYSYHAPEEGWTPLRFQDVGGGSFRAPFHGADLVPEPSIFMCTYAEVTYQARCDFERRMKPEPENKDKVIPAEAEVPALREALLMEYSGLPNDEWQERVAELQNYKEDPQAWVQAQEMADKCGCEYQVDKPDPNDPAKVKTIKEPVYPAIQQCPLFYHQNGENGSNKGNLMPDNTPVPPELDKGYCKDWKPPV